LPRSIKAFQLGGHHRVIADALSVNDGAIAWPRARTPCFDLSHVARTFYNLIIDNGLLLSTPYHGYRKDSACDGGDDHLTALSEVGHIKFFSIGILGIRLTETRLDDIRFVGIGHIPSRLRNL
jgi:hypothetical protein